MCNKTFIVTGASSGIGKEAAFRLLKAGHRVVVTSRRQDVLEDLFSDYPNCNIIPCDLTNIETIKEYAKTVNETVGPINGLVHCAGVNKLMPIHMIKSSFIEDVFSINSFAAISLVSNFAKKKYYIPNDTSMVLISSLSAHEGAYGNSVYAASKGALEGFLCAAAPELADKGIRINAVAPGQVDTPMSQKFRSNLTDEQIEAAQSEYPLGWGEPQDIANIIEFLLSEKSKWILGRTFIVDGGHLVRKC